MDLGLTLEKRIYILSSKEDDNICFLFIYIGLKFLPYLAGI